MGRIFVKGDCHRQFNFLEDFCKTFETTTDDILILLGDVGINYELNKNDISIKRKLSQYPITLFCVFGNHECRPKHILSYKFSYIDRFKCNCWYESSYPNIFFPEDGAAEINGLRFLIAGGAYSVDKDYRIELGKKWFPDEQMSKEDKLRVRAVVENNNKFDYVLSHTCPINYIPHHLLLSFIDQSFVDKSMERYLQEIYELLDKDYLKQYFFGHYHSDEILPDKFHILYHDIVMIYSN